MASRTPSSKAGRRSASVDESSLCVRLPGGEIIPLNDVDGKELMTLAMSWAYRVRYRGRWRNRKESRREVELQALADLENVVGIDAQTLQRIVDAGVAEIHIPFSEENVGWEMRILPWESLLSAAANRLPDRKRFLVVRHLDSGAEPSVARRNASKLLITSAPGELAEHYSFESERQLIQHELRSDNEIRDPTADDLRARVVQDEPEVVHFTGIDAHEGAVLLQLGEQPKDGLFLSGPHRRPELVTADDFASVVCAGKRPPSLFSCNAYNTGARIAALAVSKGCGAAVGFQDEIDHTLAELFFAEFHRSWFGGRQTLEAFQVALEAAQEAPKPMSGSCIILWVGQSLVAGLQDKTPFSPDVARGRLKVQPKTAAEAPGGGVADLVVEVKALDEVNYSLLHNGRPIFSRFKLANRSAKTIRNVEVEVSLRVAGEEATTRRTFHVDRTDDYRDRLALPLTWDVERYNESVMTTLAWTVRVDGKAVARDSVGVRLLTIDVWKDVPEERAWLPSFVLPRDPAVLEIVDKAQKYLEALSDDPVAGFDGYQSGDPDYVDLQVRALWSALVIDYDLRYVEPPPTYAKTSQRLRSPSSVVEDGRGTCIDLSLLLCSCLEYIGISGALFLLEGHCFPAYWRSFSGGSQLFDHEALIDSKETSKDYLSSRSSSGQSEAAWVLSRPRRRDQQTSADAPSTDPSPLNRALFDALSVESLVPVESVLLTRQTGLGQAVEDGWRNLEVLDDVEAMIDVAAARGHLRLPGTAAELQPVTPLPYRGGR